jgi:hypothetical protein
MPDHLRSVMLVAGFVLDMSFKKVAGALDRAHRIHLDRELRKHRTGIGVLPVRDAIDPRRSDRPQVRLLTSWTF